MKRNVHAVIALIFAWLVAVTTTAQAPSALAADQQAAAAQVEGVERELVAAIAKTDLATYDRIVADDYVAHTDSGQALTKPEILASYRTGTRRYLTLAISDVQVRVFGETAILSARTSGTRVENGGTEVPNIVRYFRVFTRRNGVWRAVMQIVTPLPASSGTK